MRLLTAVVVLASFGACDSASDSSHADATTADDHILSSATVIGAPMDPAVAGDIVWVRDAMGDPGLHQLDLETGELIRSVGRRGEGPGEFAQAPGGIFPSSGGAGAVWIWDPANQRVVEYEPAPPGDQDYRSVDIRGTPLLTHVVPLGDSLWLGQTPRYGQRFWLIDENGSALRSVEGLYHGPDHVSPDAKVLATVSGVEICPWPGRGFAVVNFSFGRIDYFSAEASFLRSADVPTPTEPVFSNSGGGEARFVRDAAHYMDCQVRDDRLFALFAGGTAISDAVSFDEASHGSDIHVFDWQGRLVDSISVSAPIRSFWIEGSQVIGTSTIDSRVYRFPMTR